MDAMARTEPMGSRSQEIPLGLSVGAGPQDFGHPPKLLQATSRELVGEWSCRDKNRHTYGRPALAREDEPIKPSSQAQWFLEVDRGDTRPLCSLY